MEKRQDMQENKIAIIAQCGADGTSAMHAYAEALIVPEGYEAEYIEILHAESAAAAYQRAMEQSSAKYKVYLSAGSVIVKADFLVEMIRICSRRAASWRGRRAFTDVCSTGTEASSQENRRRTACRM